MTPQEKKRLSYARDRRNCYGESSKGSRKVIPARKASVNRRRRHAVRRAIVEAGDPERVGPAVAALRRPSWAKIPDRPLRDPLASRGGSGRPGAVAASSD